MAKSLKNMMGVGLGAGTAVLLNGTVADGLTATGTVQTDALALSGDVNVFTTVPIGSGTRLPAIPQPSDSVVVANLGANALTVYPPLGATIANGPTNSPFSLPSGATIELTARVGSSNWIALSSGGSLAAPHILTAPIIGGRLIVGQRTFASPGSYDQVPLSIATQWQYEDGTILSDIGDNHLCDNIEEGLKLRFVEIASFTSGPQLTNPSALSAAIAARTLGAVALTRTSALAASPLAYAITLPADTYPGGILRIVTAADTPFTPLIQEIPHSLTAAEIADPTLIPAALAADGFTDPGANDVVKVILETRLPDDTVLSSLSGVIGKNYTFTPGALSGLAIWPTPKIGNRFHSTDRSVVANNGDTIGDVGDRSGFALDVTQATDANRPLAVDGSGKSWADFDGVNDTLGYTGLGGIQLTDGSGQWTAFASVKFDSVSAYQIVVDADSASNRLAQFIRISDTGHIQSIAFLADGTPIVATGTTVCSIGTWYDIVTVCSTTTLSIYLNGVLDGTASITGALYAAPHAFGLGANNITSPTTFLNGQIADAGVITGIVAGANLTNLFTYQPSTHP